MLSRSSGTTDTSSESIRCVPSEFYRERKRGILLAGGYFLTIAQEVAAVTGANDSTGKVCQRPACNCAAAPSQPSNPANAFLSVPRQRRAFVAVSADNSYRDEVGQW